MKGPLTVTFTRRPAQHDLVHVVRTGGTESVPVRPVPAARPD